MHGFVLRSAGSQLITLETGSISELTFINLIPSADVLLKNNVADFQPVISITFTGY